MLKLVICGLVKDYDSGSRTVRRDALVRRFLKTTGWCYTEDSVSFHRSVCKMTANMLDIFIKIV